MACTDNGNDTSTILGCIQEVCAQSEELVKKLKAGQDSAESLQDKMDESGQALKCVINGPADSYCNLPEGAVLPTLSEALQNLNACSISAIEGDAFTASAGQTTFTLAAAPTNNYSVEVALDGAVCRSPNDYTVTGAILTFTDGLSTGDQVDVRRFIV